MAVSNILVPTTHVRTLYAFLILVLYGDLSHVHPLRFIKKSQEKTNWSFFLLVDPYWLDLCGDQTDLFSLVDLYGDLPHVYPLTFIKKSQEKPN